MEKQKIQSKVFSLAESGLTPEMIANRIMEENEMNASNYDDPEAFSDGIKVVAQALAFRRASIMDCVAITRLINLSYKDETDGIESFRTGDCVSEALIMDMLNNVEYFWQLVEAPNGFGVETDGQMIAVGCFTVNGTSRRNGEVEGKAGSIRYLAVLPRYRGLCVGLRLLKRIERFVLESGCCRCIASIPSTRCSLQRWIERREYELGGFIPYPAIAVGHTITCTEPVRLLIYHKPLLSETSNNSSAQTGSLSSSTPTAASVCANKINDFSANLPSPPASMQPASRPQMYLPPHWRHATNKPQTSVPSDVDVEESGVD